MTVIAMDRRRALDSFIAALSEARADPAAYILIVDSKTGEPKAHPRHCAIPPGWYRLAIHIKPLPCAA